MPMINASIEECHKYGLLHDAVAVILFDKDDRILFISRSRNKLGGGKWEIPATHSTGIGWFNDGLHCIKNEIGVTNVNLGYLGEFHYSAEVDDVKENENVHVLIAEFNGLPKPNPEHCTDFAWIPLVSKAWMQKEKSYAI